MKSWAIQIFHHYFAYIPKANFTDLVEIAIIAFAVYEILLWIKNTKAWMLLKGILVLIVFISVAAIFQMNTILWLVKNSIGVLATVTVVVFQPELRRALEKLGEQNYLSAVVPFDRAKKEKVRFSNDTADAILKACYEMAKVKTGALIVIEQAIQLTEYEKTGIQLDSLVSSQLLINIFEHNTPLHDGAIIIRGDRIVSATCYLPLSDNRSLSKEMGTRHRAAVGMSEVCDAVILVVSEETGAVSYAEGGNITRYVNKTDLREKLAQIQKIGDSQNNHFIKLMKGRGKDEGKIEE